jgi:hypothetical protein
MFLTYDIVHCVPAIHIQHEYGFGSPTVTDWRHFVREAMFVYLHDSSQKIGGPNKTVEIDESKFGKRKYHRGHRVQGQWIFGGVERDTGRAFFVPIMDRTAETLTLFVLGSNQAPKSSAIVGQRTAVSISKVTRMKPSTTGSVSLIMTLARTQILLRAAGGT